MEMHLAKHRVHDARATDEILLGDDQRRAEADAVVGAADQQAAAGAERGDAPARHAGLALVDDDALEKPAALAAVRQDVRRVEFAERVVEQVAEALGARGQVLVF